MVLLQTFLNFGDVFAYLKYIGVIDFVLPFLLVFSIVFAILEKTKILGSEKTNISVVVSSVIALLLVMQQGIVQIINLFLPRVSLIIVVILMGLLLISLLAGREYQGLSGSMFGLAIILVIVAIVLALTLPPATSGFFISEADKQALLRIGIPIAVFLLAIYLVTSGGEKKKKESILERLARDVGGK